MKNTTRKSIREAEHHTKASGAINRMFSEMGYKKLGSGAEAAVWAKDDESVIKVIMPEDRDGMDAAAKTFYTFYEFCSKNSDQSNLPRFVEITKNGHHKTFEVDGKEYIMIGIERLQPIKEGSMSQALVWIMSDLVSKGYNWERAYKEMIKPSTWKFWDPPPTSKEVVKFLKGVDGMTYVKFDVLYTLMLLLYKRGKINKLGWDLHTENVMERKDGTLVITDPWFTSEI
jgi:hypothetical protein